MNDTPILCPYCGAEMTYQRGRDLSCSYANYYCPECYATSSRYFCSEIEHLENVAASAAQLARTRYTPPLEPMPFGDIAHTTTCIPCWMENQSGIWADVLDRTMCGSYYGWTQQLRGISGYWEPADYNKTWRCWASYPSVEDRLNTLWATT